MPYNPRIPLVVVVDPIKLTTVTMLYLLSEISLKEQT